MKFIDEKLITNDIKLVNRLTNEVEIYRCLDTESASMLKRKINELYELYEKLDKRLDSIDEKIEHDRRELFYKLIAKV